MRSRFDEQLELLNTELIKMGGLVENAIESASYALVQKSVDQAKDAIVFDHEIDQKEKVIENLCLKLLLQQQPVAKDLRLISSALKMITDLERIGDQATDISEIVIYLVDQAPIKQLEHLPQMAAVTKEMVNKSVDAFVRKDLNLIREVVKMDDKVDDLFITIKKELIDLIGQSPETGEQAVDLLMIAKYLERIGDHAENIAEWVEFSISGIHKHKGEILE
jgi:phosphate transport system protein